MEAGGAIECVGGRPVDEHNRRPVATRPVRDLSAIPRRDAGLDFYVMGISAHSLPLACIGTRLQPPAWDGMGRATQPFRTAAFGVATKPLDPDLRREHGLQCRPWAGLLGPVTDLDLAVRAGKKSGKVRRQRKEVKDELEEALVLAIQLLCLL